MKHIDNKMMNGLIVKIMEGDSVIDTITEIEIPSDFKRVITKLHPEVRDVETEGFKVVKKYDTTTLKSCTTFDPLNYFEVGVKLFFGQDEIPKGNKEYYKKLFDEMFVMTYGIEMDFVSFRIVSLVVPRVKSNEEKFVEIFAKNHILKK